MAPEAFEVSTLIFVLSQLSIKIFYLKQNLGDYSLLTDNTLFVEHLLHIPKSKLSSRFNIIGRLPILPSG
jgi:hypothetical protein